MISIINHCTYTIILTTKLTRAEIAIVNYIFLYPLSTLREGGEDYVLRTEYRMFSVS